MKHAQSGSNTEQGDEKRQGGQHRELLKMVEHVCQDGGGARQSLCQHAELRPVWNDRTRPVAYIAPCGHAATAPRAHKSLAIKITRTTTLLAQKMRWVERVPEEGVKVHERDHEHELGVLVGF